MLSAGPPATLRRLSTRRLARHGRADRDRRTPSAPARGPRPPARAGGRGRAPRPAPRRGARGDHGRRCRRDVDPHGGRRRLAPARRAVVRASSSPTATGAALAGARLRARRSRRAGPTASRAVARALARAGRAARPATTPDGPRGAGPVAVGGFAFAPDGGGAPHWAGFAPASLHVPEVALARRGDEVRLTLAALAAPDDVARRAASRASSARAAELRERAAAAARPGPGRALPGRQRDAARALRGGGRARRRADPRRARSRRSCSRARSRSTRRAPHDAAGASSASCARRSRRATSSASAAATRAFVAASPELLVRREGLRAGTLALAGSTRRSADPAVDDHLGEQLLRSAKDREEQAIVTRRIVRALRPHSVWVTARRGAGRREDGEHPAPRHADPRAARRARSSAVELAGAAAPDARRRRRAARGRRAADPGARGPRPRLVRRARSAGPTRPRTASSASRCAARC